MLISLVRPSVERTIQDLLNPVVDRSIKIALTTCEQIVKKVSGNICWKGLFFFVCLVVGFFWGVGGGGGCPEVGVPWSFVWTRKFPGIVWSVGGTEVCGFASTVLCACLFKTWWAFQSYLAVSTIWVDRSGCTSMPKMWPVEMLFQWTWWKFRTRLKSVQKVCFRVRCARKWQKRQCWTSYLF